MVHLVLAVSRRGGALLILAFTTLWDQLNVDKMEGLRAKALSHSELAESNHRPAPMPLAGSTVYLLGALWTVSDAEVCFYAVKGSYVEGSVAQEPGMAIASELE